MTLPRRARCSRVYPQAVVADKAFDADHLRQSIAQRGPQAVIPPRSNRNAPAFYFKHHYKHRNLIEPYFCRIKHFRRTPHAMKNSSSASPRSSLWYATFVWLN